MIEKITLSEQFIITGDVSMPKGFEINSEKFRADILESFIKKEEFSFSKNFDLLNTFIKDHIRVKYDINLINKKTWGNAFTSKITEPLLEVDPVDLRNSPDYILLYGVDVDKCHVRIYYDDNRRKGRSWDIELKNNKFILFPSTNLYTIRNNQNKTLNYIQFISYEFI